MKNKKLFLKISVIVISILILAILILAFLGKKERVGYLSEFKINVDKTLELNRLNIEETKQLFTIDGNLDETAITNYIFTNSSITNYSYDFRVKYYSKIFRNSDIYGVYPNIDNILKNNSFIKEIKMGEKGSPFGNLIYTKIIDFEKIDDIKYILKLKNNFLTYTISFLLFISILIYIYNSKKIITLKEELVFSFIIIFISILIVFIHFNLNKIFEFGFPFYYETYGDQSHFLIVASMVNNEGWAPISTDRFAYPFGRYLGTYTMFLFMNFEVLLMKIISIFVSDPLYILYIAYYLIFPITFIISFFVMRNLKISRFMSVFGSLLFTFIPYVFLRNTMHYNYSTIYFIPLLILLCIWLYEDDQLLMPNKLFFKNKKNIMSIIIIILITNSGGGYYQFFSGFFICLVGLSKFIKTKRLSSVLNVFISLAIFILFFIIIFSPLIIYNIFNDISFADTIKPWNHGEIYAFKLSHFLLNPKIFGNYYSTALLVNENITEYSGLIPIFGFIFLLIYLLIKNDNNILKDRFVLFSEFNIFAIIFATVGGFSALFSFFVSAEIRGYNRISIYITYISILAFSIFIDKTIKRKNIIFYILFTLLFTFVLYEQLPNFDFFNVNQKNKYLEEKAFIENIEQNMPNNSAIYQLPTTGFLLVFNNIYDPHPFKNYICYIFSKKLKWSYGAEGERKENEWYDKVNIMNANNLLNEISYAGFDGIYIDKKLYGNNDHIDNLIKEIESLTHNKPLISDSKDMLFFDIRDFKKNKLDTNYTPLINQYIKNK